SYPEPTFVEVLDYYGSSLIHLFYSYDNIDRLTPPVASAAASSKSDPDRPHRPGQREPPHSSVFVGESNSALSGGDFQGMGVFRSDEVWGRAREEFARSLIAFDEPTSLSLRSAAFLQSPLPFRR